jgi:hypothetical protein
MKREDCSLGSGQDILKARKVVEFLITSCDTTQLIAEENRRQRLQHVLDLFRRVSRIALSEFSRTFLAIAVWISHDSRHRDLSRLQTQRHRPDNSTTQRNRLKLITFSSASNFRPVKANCNPFGNCIKNTKTPFATLSSNSDAG